MEDSNIHSWIKTFINWTYISIVQSWIAIIWTLNDSTEYKRSDMCIIQLYKNKKELQF